MTITKRVTAIPSGGATRRIAATASGGQTKRITAAATESITRRASLDAGHETVYDAWGGTWGDAWGESWRIALAGSVIGHTFRVSGTASGGQTKRVTM